ncbi:MAG: hypothetical protein V1690_03965 [Candidatus Moraniibacteriota bacterium]
MNSTQINIKIDTKTKEVAQRAASEIGISLSRIIVAYLREFGRTKTIYFSTGEEEPSDYLIESIKRSEEDIRKGRLSPAFDNAEDAIKWLNRGRKKRKTRAPKKSR